MGERRRNLLHIKKIQAFKAWMRGQGYDLAPKKGIHEVARFTNPSVKGDLRTVILFMKDGASEHVTVQGAAVGLVQDFIDGGIAQKRLDEIKANPESVVRGPELDKILEEK